MTSEAPRQMPATTTSAAPSCQSVPATKNMRLAARAPAHANPPSRRVGRGLRSAMAPMKIRTIAERIVVKVTVKNHSDPGATGMPSTERFVVQSWPSGRPGQAASSATVVR